MSVTLFHKNPFIASCPDFRNNQPFHVLNYSSFISLAQQRSTTFPKKKTVLEKMGNTTHGGGGSSSRICWPSWPASKIRQFQYWTLTSWHHGMNDRHPENRIQTQSFFVSFCDRTIGPPRRISLSIKASLNGTVFCAFKSLNWVFFKVHQYSGLIHNQHA